MSALSIAKGMIPETMHSLLNYALNVRFFSPRVQAFRQLTSGTLSQFPEENIKEISQKCAGWILFNQKFHCNTDSILPEIEHTA